MSAARHGLAVLVAAAVVIAAFGAGSARAAESPTAAILLRPARVFDGSAMHAGWRVLVQGERIAAVGPDVSAPVGAREIDLPNDTLIPGLIEGHGHLFL